MNEITITTLMILLVMIGVMGLFSGDDLDVVCSEEGGELYRNGEWHCKEKIGTYAHLANQTQTTITNANQWYAVNGIYHNDPIKGFYVNTSIPAIVFDGDDPAYMEIQQHISVSSDINGASIHIGIAKNGVIEEDHKMGTFLKTRLEPFSISQNEVLYLEKGDYLQLVIQSDKNNDIATVYHHTTSVRRFY